MDNCRVAVILDRQDLNNFRIFKSCDVEHRELVPSNERELYPILNL